MKRHEEELDELNKKQRKEIEKLALECRSYVKMVMKQEEYHSLLFSKGLWTSTCVEKAAGRS